MESDGDEVDALFREVMGAGENVPLLREAFLSQTDVRALLAADQSGRPIA